MIICGICEYAKNRQALANQQNAHWSLKKSAQLFDFPSVRWLLKHCRSQVGPSVKLTRIGLGFFGKNSWSPTNLRFDGTLATSATSSSHKVMTTLLIFNEKYHNTQRKIKIIGLWTIFNKKLNTTTGLFTLQQWITCWLTDWHLVWIPFKCQLGTA